MRGGGGDLATTLARMERARARCQHAQGMRIHTTREPGSRGRKEPHAAARADRRNAPATRCTPTSASTRGAAPPWATCRSGCTARHRRRGHRDGSHRRPGATPWLLKMPLDVQAQPARRVGARRTPAPSPGGPAPECDEGAVAASRRARRRPPSRNGVTVGRARGQGRAGRMRSWRNGRGALLATLGVAPGVHDDRRTPRHSRRLRQPNGRRAESPARATWC